MSKPKVHLSLNIVTKQTACNSIGNPIIALTKGKRHVTCKKCLKAYANGARGDQ